MRILVTGSNGFLGSRIVEDAHARGWQVIGMGRSATSSTPVDSYVRHDLTSPIAYSAIGDVDAVVHCAALASPWAAPQDFVAANVDGTRHALRWAADHGAPPFLYVSSSSVLYRDADQFNLTEESPIPCDNEQINSYSRTKRIGERIVEQYPGQWAILRPRAIFGVGDTVLLPRIFRLAKTGVLPVLERPGRMPVRIDLTDVHTAAHYVGEAITRKAEGVYNMTNAQPVDLYPFLLDVLAKLGAFPRTVRVDPRLVNAVAAAGEWASALLFGWREPPLTRFGASVLSRSKTFDVSRLLKDLGPPAVSIDEAVDRLVAAHG